MSWQHCLRLKLPMNYPKSSAFKLNFNLLYYFPQQKIISFPQKNDLNLKLVFQYTGDFRYENIGLGTLTALHDADGRVLKFDELYLDTTFCSKNYLNFPSREEALQVRSLNLVLFQGKQIVVVKPEDQIKQDVIKTVCQYTYFAVTDQV